MRGVPRRIIDPGELVTGERMKLPLIAWGADVITMYANGNSAMTKKGSLFDQAGLNFELFREDNFEKQVDLFIRGEIAFLRGTMGMINMAMDRLSASPATRPVLVFQHSWSAGGDALVVKSGINSVADLKGKTIAIQKNGPHVDYFLKLLKDARVNGSDVNIFWTKDLVGASGDTPMAKLPSRGIDAAFRHHPRCPVAHLAGERGDRRRGFRQGGQDTAVNQDRQPHHQRRLCRKEGLFRQEPRRGEKFRNRTLSRPKKM